MWGEVGTAEEDQLDAGQAKKVIRRACTDAAPVPTPGDPGRSAHRACGPGSILAGPFFVKYGIDQGISKGDATGPEHRRGRLRRRRHRVVLRLSVRR